MSARSDLFAIADALARFALENEGRLPNELSELWKLDSRGSRFLDVDGPVLDPWDNSYHYEPSSDAASFRVFSLGEDGRPGGEGEDADLEIVRAR
jgi:general secretion pathway protein G